MTPSWYDVLDVDEDAGADEIRARWRTAIADLDPADRRFRRLNQAAEVLLDPVRRSAHDAALAADAGPETDPEPDPGAAGPEPAGPAPAVPTAVPTAGLTTVLVAQARRDPVAAAATSRWSGWAPPTWLLLGMALVTAGLVALVAWRFSVPDDASVQADTRAAQGAAEDAAVAVLSYDYRDLDATKRAASAYLTPAFRRDYEQLFAQIEANAETVRPVVTAEVVASGVERVSADGQRVSVLVFVNRPTANAQLTGPVTYQDQATLQMEQVDGDWLLDDLTTAPAAP